MADPGESPAFVGLVQATAGAAGGVMAAAALMPLEVAKTRIQISHRGDLSVMGTMVSILNKEGIAGLFRGSFAKCSENGSKNFIYFYIYDACNAAAKSSTELTTAIKLILGFVAGMGCTIATMPLEVLSTKLQADTEVGVGLLALTRRVLEKEGISGLFKGFWYNILLCVNPAIQNTCFDRFKEIMLRLNAKASGGKDVALTAFQAFVLGAIAKAIATLATYPLVRLKTILQAGKDQDLETHPVKQPSNDGAPELKRVRSSTGEMLSTISLREDVQPNLQGPVQRLEELYRGVGSTLFKSVVQGALLYVTMEQVSALVRTFFKLSSKAFFRKDGRMKLGAFSGRPLAS